MMRRTLFAGLLLLAVAWASDSQELENVTCPGGTAQCPYGNTCCELPTGEYGCCPLPNAVCCSDHEHCCPHGYTCDVSGGTCQQGAVSFPWVKKNVAKPIKVESVVCPGGQESCPDGSTCCSIRSGGYGCCPLPNAVCCSDQQHCCPNGYTCSGGGFCTREDQNVAWLIQNVAEPSKVNVEGVVCPDGTSVCPTGSSCCKMSKDKWGCCPVLDAVCCDDYKHCCAKGEKCDKGRCTKSSVSTPWLTKFEAKPMAPKESIPWLTKTLARKFSGVGIVQCDSKSACPDGNTCCKLASGEWGCCPIVQAVCCSDGIHCCPNGYTCDVSQGTCQKEAEAVAWSSKTFALAAFVGDVPCDSSHSCPDGNTCCMLASGQWGCCPYPKAVCCSDKEHCCPQDTTCNIPQGKCDKKLQPLGWTTETLALQVGIGAVQCDATHYCPSGTTCCRLSSGQWGCCPFPNAVCCSDGIHCCPNGYTCNGSQGTCQREAEAVAWSSKTSALAAFVGDVACDSSHSCPDGNTCCMLASGQWGCCPYPKAVCCSDKEHCCPQDTTCNIPQGKCDKKLQPLGWTTETLALQVGVGIVRCDATHYCPSGTTCCRLASGQWGCCPVPNAVCCADRQHCCPSGYTCSGTQCVR